MAWESYNVGYGRPQPRPQMPGLLGPIPTVQPPATGLLGHPPQATPQVTPTGTGAAKTPLDLKGLFGAIKDQNMPGVRTAIGTDMDRWKESLAGVNKRSGIWWDIDPSKWGEDTEGRWAAMDRAARALRNEPGGPTGGPNPATPAYQFDTSMPWGMQPQAAMGLLDQQLKAAMAMTPQFMGPVDPVAFKKALGSKSTSSSREDGLKTKGERIMEELESRRGR
jgi:hypothetical protein